METPVGREGIERLNLQRFDGKRFSDAPEEVVREMLLEIVVEGRPFAAIACAGIHLRELTAGFLKQEGLIDSPAGIRDMRISSDRVEVFTCGSAGSVPPMPAVQTIGSSGSRGRRGFEMERKQKTIGPFGPKLDVQLIFQLMDELLAATVIHERTRGTHCSALASTRGILAAREDIGRHNTIDMLCGWALLEGVDLADKILLTTGRVSSEIVSKAQRMGVCVIVSHSAATSRAVRLAESLGIVVVGYVRGKTFIVYAGAQRVKSDETPKAKGQRRKGKKVKSE
ncbi:MAG TPA: formate dehydrogenase accessory sulfurtransferase FdhD [Syntrophales bacterium]|nr:formate dehydrogenase accessory sulfurtransferase FdhD [Syntrophales bacterium]